MAPVGLIPADLTSHELQLSKTGIHHQALDHQMVLACAGHYAMAVGDAEAAAAKFMAAAKSNPSGHQACLAAVSAALALLATGQAEDLLKAADLLQHQQLFKGLDASLPYAERYAAIGHMVGCAELHCQSVLRMVMLQGCMLHHAFAGLIIAVL